MEYAFSAEAELGFFRVCRPDQKSATRRPSRKITRLRPDSRPSELELTSIPLLGGVVGVVSSGAGPVFDSLGVGARWSCRVLLSDCVVGKFPSTIQISKLPSLG